MQMDNFRSPRFCSRALWTYIVFVFGIFPAGLLAWLAVWGLGVWLGYHFGLAGFIAAVIVWVFLTISFCVQALDELPTEPPTSGIIAFWGRWIWGAYVGPGGIIWLPLRNFLFSMDQVIVKAFNLDFHRIPRDMEPEKARAAEEREALRCLDNGRVIVPVHTTSAPSNLIIFEMMGGVVYQDAAHADSPDIDKGVPNILHDVIDHEVREWIRNPTYGPRTTDEAISAGDDAVAMILEGIIGRSFQNLEAAIAETQSGWRKRYLEGLAQKHQKQVSQMPDIGIPADVLIRYFAEPQLPPLLAHARGGYGNVEKEEDKERNQKAEPWNWNGLEKKLEALSSSKQRALKQWAHQRRRLIHELGAGNGSLELIGLGIVFQRLNLGKIREVGDLVKAKDNVAIEAQQRVADRRNRQSYEENIQAIINRAKELGCDVSWQDASRDFFSFTAGDQKIQRESKETVFTINADTREVIEAVTRQVIERISSKKLITPSDKP